jgi:hypothetical protein
LNGLTVIGIPIELSPEELGTSIINARDGINDEAARSGTRDPAEVSHNVISDSDVAALRSKFPFLKDFSDNFIRSNKPDSLMKLETANMKLKEAERTKDADDKLAHNRSNIGTICVDMGLDDRTTILHDGRFLPGANCSAAKLWLAARNRIPLHGAPPLGNYDMAAVGLGGFVSPRGWVELANPASTRLSLRQFNINNCTRKTSGSKENDNDNNTPDFSEIGEFQLALRTLRTAAAFIMPWNFSFTAIENFLINTRYCKDDLGNIENKAQILTQFTDYVLSENASKWRDAEPFLSSGELKNTWNAFFTARPQSAFIKKVSPKSDDLQSKKQGQKQPRKLPFIDVCYNWNKGTCNKPTGTCFSSRGNALRHVCDQRTDPNNLLTHCGQNHRRCVAHP